MFGFVNSQKEKNEVGGEIEQDRRRRELYFYITFGIVAFVVLNVVLYFISNS
jgi:predicted nucleic acid-binding Zn ribbon protein